MKNEIRWTDKAREKAMSILKQPDWHITEESEDSSVYTATQKFMCEVVDLKNEYIVNKCKEAMLKEHATELMLIDKESLFDYFRKLNKIKEYYGNVCPYCGQPVENVSKWVFPKQTNGDRIRGMTDEELADFLAEILTYCGNNYCEITREKIRCPIEDWLKEEVNE